MLSRIQVNKLVGSVSSLHALESESFRNYLSGQSISAMGTGMQQVALAWLVYRTTQSAWALGALTIAALLGQFFTSFIGGYLADRTDRRRLLIKLQWIGAALASFLALAVFLKIANVPFVMFCSLLLGAFLGMEYPVRQSLNVHLVKPDHTLSARGLYASVVSSSVALGQASAGILIDALPSFGEVGCMLLNAVSYLFSVLLLSKLAFNTSAPRFSEEKTIPSGKCELVSTAVAVRGELAPTEMVERGELAPTAMVEHGELAPTTETERGELAPTTETERGEMAPTAMDVRGNDESLLVAKVKEGDSLPRAKTNSGPFSAEKLKTLNGFFSNFKDQFHCIIRANKECFQFVMKSEILLITFVQTIVLVLFATRYIPLLPAFAAEVFSAGAKASGILTGAVALGYAAGALVCGALKNNKRLELWADLTLFLLPLAMLLFCQAGELHIGLFCVFLMAICQSANINACICLLQLNAPQEIFGRLMGFRVMVVALADLLGAAVVTLVVHELGLTLTTMIAAFICFALAILIFSRRALSSVLPTSKLTMEPAVVPIAKLK